MSPGPARGSVGAVGGPDERRGHAAAEAGQALSPGRDLWHPAPMKMLRGACGALVAALLVLTPPATPARADVDVDLELVLAVDISMSMDPEEQKLQREGYVEAFRDPNVILAIKGGGKRGRIAVTYIEWAGPQTQNIIVPWRVIDSRESAEAFAADLLRQPYSRRSMTSISSALLFAKDQFGKGGFRGGRQVIDVSGDGVNNSGAKMSVVRPQVLEAGIIINGLPILVKPTTTWTAWDGPDLDLYYANCVIGGSGAFSIPIHKNEDFAVATRQKILLEVAGVTVKPRVVRVQDSRQGGAFDCAVYERNVGRHYGD